MPIGQRHGAVQSAVQGAVAGAVQGCSGSCLPLLTGCFGSCLPLGGVRVLSRVLCRGAVQGGADHVFAIGRCQGAVQGAPDHVCHLAVSACCPGCCPGCSGSCLPLGGVRVLSSLPLGGVRVLSRVLCRGAVQGGADHVCHWAVSGCCPGCCPDHVCDWMVSEPSRVLSKMLSKVLSGFQRFDFYLGSMLVCFFSSDLSCAALPVTERYIYIYYTPHLAPWQPYIDLRIPTKVLNPLECFCAAAGLSFNMAHLPPRMFAI